MQTRLTVFLSGPNNYKGNLFDGTAPVDVTNFSKIKDTEQQMTLAPAVGMISPYMNNDDVWESFCDTYNAIYNVLSDFDVWYQLTANPSNKSKSNLSAEWAKHIRAELDMVVTNARKNVEDLEANKINNAAYAAKWFTILNSDGPTRKERQLQKIALKRVDKCRALPASTVKDP